MVIHYLSRRGCGARGFLLFAGGEEGGEGGEGGALDFTMSERWMDDFAKLTQKK